MLSRVCRVGVSPALKSFIKTAVVPAPFIPRIQTTRLLANDGRTAVTRSSRTGARTTIKEKILSPSGGTAISIGQYAIISASVVGIGALCYYGLGLSSTTGIIDTANLWPQHVKDRVRTTYMYVAGSVIATAASAAMCIRSPTIMRVVANQRIFTTIAIMGSMILTASIADSIPYKEGFGAKQLAWLAHTGIVGAVIAPLYLFGGPIVLRAATYTAGMIGGLSALALCAPNEKFLTYGSPLAIGFGVVFASTVGSYFLPPTTVLGSGLYSISIYGGLILFSVMLMYNTQRFIKDAETRPKYNLYGEPSYDPVRHAMSLYMDIMNIFIRIATIMISGGSKRK